MKKFIYTTHQDATGTYVRVNDKKNNGQVIKITVEAKLRDDLDKLLKEELLKVAEKIKSEFQSWVDQ
jgi:hypothetical protein